MTRAEGLTVAALLDDVAHLVVTDSDVLALAVLPEEHPVDGVEEDAELVLGREGYLLPGDARQARLEPVDIRLVLVEVVHLIRLEGDREDGSARGQRHGVIGRETQGGRQCYKRGDEDHPRHGTDTHILSFDKRRSLQSDTGPANRPCPGEANFISGGR
jgi:hypothetical protein